MCWDCDEYVEIVKIMCAKKYIKFIISSQKK
nr:MAG TPA: Glucagon, DIABETES, OBESITY, LIPIDATED, LIPID [Caudoviricetes sp.]